MNRFSAKSVQRLYSCRRPLIDLFEAVLPVHDCSILEGHRSNARQLALYDEGKTKIPSQGPHNWQVSRAVDVAPYPINWENTKRFYFFAGIVMAKADDMGIDVRWGGDWNSNNNLDDQNFFDLVHWELDCK